MTGMETSLLNSTRGEGAGQPSAISAAIGTNSEASDLFTKLLVAQIRNQNPLEPSDPSEFVNQLTQLSQMESMQALTRHSAASASMIESLQVIALGAQVGSQVTVRTDRVTLGSEPVGGGFTLDSASAQTTLVLTGADGVEHALPLGTRQPGEVNFHIDPAAMGLPPGTYSLAVKTDSEASGLQIESQLAGVKLSPSGSVVLRVAHVGEVAPESITQFNGRP
jgi:flagellar basal-body rod modification protein FlgD